MKIAIANVKYSPNLGDGLLSECLEHGMSINRTAYFDIVNCDLAARTQYCPGGTINSNRLKYLSILDSTPKLLRRIVLRSGLALKSIGWRKHYDSCIGDAEAIVIGGGNLFTDVDLNFPTKICVLLRLAKQRRQPVFLYGVGVGGMWSKRGLSMMRKALEVSDIRSVSVRDDKSQQNFLELFGDVVKVEPTVVRDPGLIASNVYGTREKGVGRGVGVCLTSPDAISYHSNVSVSKEYLLNWYEQLCTHLLSQHQSIYLFTNGGEEDVVFASEVSKCIYDKTGMNLEVKSADSPEELAEFISDLEVVVAYRMHALICAYSYGRTIVAFEWDPKVKSLMNSLGLGQFLLDVNRVSPSDVVQLILSVTSSPASEFQTVVTQAQTDIDGLVRSIQKQTITLS